MASDSLVEVLELENLLVQILCVRLTQKAASGICWPEPIVGLEYSLLPKPKPMDLTRNGLC